mmetsp:Transcript_8548/g.26931  ORF Transcript_8548/g.26931 Transcript_8548/m.26931 type:complete len:345 (+) Transcript_8548:644-1678(+)
MMSIGRVRLQIQLVHHFASAEHDSGAKGDERARHEGCHDRHERGWRRCVARRGRARQRQVRARARLVRRREVETRLLAHIAQRVDGEVVDVELRPRLAKRDLVVRDCKLLELLQREKADVGDDGVRVALVRAHAARGGDNDIVALPVELLRHRDVLRDWQARCVIARRLRRADERVVQVEAETEAWHLRVASAKCLDLRGRAKHVEVVRVQPERGEGRAGVEHRFDHARRVKLAHLVLRELRRARAEQRLALGREARAVGEAVAARVGVVGDLDLLLDVLDQPRARVYRHVRVDWLRVEGVEMEDGVVPLARNLAVLRHNVRRVEGVTVAEHDGAGALLGGDAA